MMRTLLLVIVCAALLAGCQTSRDLNPGAPVLWTVTDYSVLQADAHAAFLVTDPAAAKNKEQVEGILVHEGGAPHIYVWSKADLGDPQHEFCHLVDECGGNPELALAELTPPGGVPPAFRPTFDGLRAFVARMRPGGSIPHWRLLLALYGRGTVQHSVILRILDGEGPNPPPAPPYPGLGAMTLDD